MNDRVYDNIERGPGFSWLHTWLVDQREMNERKNVSMSAPGTGATSERGPDLHVVRVADPAPATHAGPETVMEPWEVRWRRSLRLQRALQDDLMNEIKHGQTILAERRTREELWRGRRVVE